MNARPQCLIQRGFIFLSGGPGLGGQCSLGQGRRVLGLAALPRPRDPGSWRCHRPVTSSSLCAAAGARRRGRELWDLIPALLCFGHRITPSTAHSPFARVSQSHGLNPTTREAGKRSLPRPPGEEAGPGLGLVKADTVFAAASDQRWGRNIIRGTSSPEVFHVGGCHDQMGSPVGHSQDRQTGGAEAPQVLLNRKGFHLPENQGKGFLLCPLPRPEAKAISP